MYNHDIWELTLVLTSFLSFAICQINIPPYSLREGKGAAIPLCSCQKKPDRQFLYHAVAESPLGIKQTIFLGELILSSSSCWLQYRKIIVKATTLDDNYLYILYFMINFCNKLMDGIKFSDKSIEIFWQSSWSNRAMKACR